MSVTHVELSPEKELDADDALAERVSVIAADVERMLERATRLEGAKVRADLALANMMSAAELQLNMLQHTCKAMEAEDWANHRHTAEALHRSAAELVELLTPIVQYRAVVQPPRLVAVS